MTKKNTGKVKNWERKASEIPPKRPTKPKEGNKNQSKEKQ